MFFQPKLTVSQFEMFMGSSVQYLLSVTEPVNQIVPATATVVFLVSFIDKLETMKIKYMFPQTKYWLSKLLRSSD